MYKRVDVPTFGGTLALKGAIEEQHAVMPHCEYGCFYCEAEVERIFEYWLNEQTEFASAAHEHVRFGTYADSIGGGPVG